jgi:hypothetical protein
MSSVMNKPINGSVVKEYSKFMPALVGTVVVLAPAVLGLARPPHIFRWVFFVACGTLITSFGFLGFAYLRTLAASASPPIRTLGVGNCLAFLGMLLLALFAQVNIAEDLLSTPRVTAIHANPLVVEAGGIVELAVDAEDQRGDRLTYAWFDGRTQIGHLQAFSFQAPMTLGLHQIEVRVSDGGNVVTERVGVVVKAPTRSCSKDVPASVGKAR